jgi:hypothetical protein
LTACIDLRLEQANHAVHLFVGGSMENVYYSPQDWLFFVHHAFIDYIWTQFREKNVASPLANRYNPDYDACTKYHTAKAVIEPFGPNRNIDAFLANDLYSSIYAYEPVPMCNANDTNCDDITNYFCHTKLGRCLSRIKLGGVCTGLDAFTPCEDLSICIEGRCQYVGIQAQVATDVIGAKGNSTQEEKKFPPALVLENGETDTALGGDQNIDDLPKPPPIVQSQSEQQAPESTDKLTTVDFLTRKILSST